MRTLCKNCIFAIHENDTDIPVPRATYQTGCKLDRLEKYKLLDCVVEAEEVETGDKSFVIENRYCLACRNHDWGDKVDKEKWEEAVREEMALQFQVLIFHDKEESDLKQTIESLANQSRLPVRIVIIMKPDCVQPPEKIVEYMDSIGIEWKIQNILQPKMRDDKCIDIVQEINPRQYYAVFHAGCIVPFDFLETINYAVNELMLQFAMILPNSSEDGMVVPTSIHQYYGGNFSKKLEKKIEEDGCLENMIPATTICPSFPE
tara:strand:+ start:3407 stop:4189 length:783 start_codon:yes stop_codon:yes gene_type:complete